MRLISSEELPLKGIRVVEFCAVAAGPFCGMLLADLGADVIKIEPPGGDVMRSWPPLSEGYSENFASLNRNKRSVVLDLKNPKDRDVAKVLIGESDVLIENNRPGVMGRLGLSYEEMREGHRNLIYCSISAYGQGGPRGSEGGFDLTIQADAGVMSVTGDNDGAPAKCGVPLVDFASGLYAAYAIAAKLAEVRTGSSGAHIDIPMFGCTLGIAALQTSEYFGSGQNPSRLGSAHPRNAPYQAFEASDGYFAIAAGNQKLWAAVCQAMGLEHLMQDVRFMTISDRARNQLALQEILGEVFRTSKVDHWINVFEHVGVPHARINSYSDALADPQVGHMGWVQSIELPNGVRTRTFGCPIRFDDAMPPIRRAPPGLGEHTESVLEQIRERQGDLRSL